MTTSSLASGRASSDCSARRRGTSDAVAINDGERALTYGEALSLSNQLARHLIERGLQSEQVVGISLDRSAEMVISLLAVLQAGGAFVPLDPQWPAARRESVITDAEVVLLLGTGTEVEAVQVDLADWGFGEYSAGPTDITIVGASLAYVIFTSGSTGTPKGAMIRHEAIAERLRWQVEQILGFGPGDASLFKAPLSFDICVNEILLPLVSGGYVVVAEPGGERDPQYLLDLIATERRHVRLPGVVDAGRAAATRRRHPPAGRAQARVVRRRGADPGAVRPVPRPARAPRSTTATARPRRRSASRT